MGAAVGGHAGSLLYIRSGRAYAPPTVSPTPGSRVKTLWRHARLVTMAGSGPWGLVEDGALLAEDGT